MKNLFTIPEYIKVINDRITFVDDILASGISASIKEGKSKDLALIFSKSPAVSSAVFTTNKLKGSHIEICKNNLKKSKFIQAIIINSGNANAATGKKGTKDALKIISELSKSLNLEKEKVLIASTGIIGVPLPVKKIIEHIPQLIANLSKKGGLDASKAILTTDKFEKTFACEVKLSKGKIKIGAMGKGAGMIAPNMATMLCFVATSLKATKKQLDFILRDSVKDTFNHISVDGDMSPNDSVFLLANGSSNVSIKNNDDLKKFTTAIKLTFYNLALKIVSDGEGAKKVILINISGAYSNKDAYLIAKSIGNSNLVKTAISGGDPNWGRIINAVGYSHAKFSFKGFELFFGNIMIAKETCKVKFDENKINKFMKNSIIEINLKFKDGKGNCLFLASDLTKDYVKFNSKYKT